MTSLHFHPLTVKSVRPDTDEAVIVSFDVPEDLSDAFRFTQGQHLTLRNSVAGSDERRSYSICSGVDDGELRVGIRKVPGGRFSTWVHESLKPGDTIQVMAPEGRFFVPLDPAAARHYLGIAGGSGITPILSIMKTVLAAEPGSRFTLIYGNRKLRSTMFLEELEDLKNRYLSRLTLHLVFSQESTDLPLYGGRIGRDKIGEFLGTLVDPALDRPCLRLRPARRQRRGRGGAAAPPACRPSGSTSSASASPMRPARRRCSRCAKATPPTPG